MSRRRILRKVLRFGLVGVSILVIASAIAVFSFAPSIIAKRFNPVSNVGIQPIAENVQKIHQSLAIADLHADSLLWGSDLSKSLSYGHVDIPRLIQGNMALQVFTVVTKVPSPLFLEGNSDRTDDVTKLAIVQRWPMPAWTNLTERALYQADRLASFAAESQGKFRIIKSKQDLSNYLAQRQSDRQITAGLLGLEGAQAVEGKLENLDRLYQAGFRLIGLAHFFDNEVSGSAHGTLKGGLTPFGREVVQQMQERHIIIDLAHASTQTIDDVLQIAKQPILVSHTGVQGICNNPRNLSDRQIAQIAQHDGIIGIGFWKTATCGEDVKAVVRAIRYVKELVGVEHVALGSDFDGSVRLPFDVANMAQITNALLADGFSQAEVEKIVGLNVFNLLQKSLT